MPVATTSTTGRALYDHASKAFVHNMPLETLTTIHKALHGGQARSTQQLAEQFIVLQITALCSTYAPNDPAQLQARIQHWRQSSTARANAQLPDDLTKQLHLPPKKFFASLWSQTLRFYHGVPTLRAIASGAEPSIDEDAIVKTPDNLPSALQLPAPVFEALVLGALKVDEDLARRSNDQANGKKKKKEVPPGLEAARAMCEWLLAAHSSPASVEIERAAISEREQSHLYDQYGRVLRLYALDVLGLRMQEWDYAGEMIRCAKLITHDEREIHERTALLNELAQSQSQVEVRIDRQQLAKERARRYLQEQLEKRKASAVSAASNASSPSTSSVLSPTATGASHRGINGDRQAKTTHSGENGKQRAVSQSPLASPSTEKGPEASGLNGYATKQSSSPTSRSRSSSASNDRQQSQRPSSSSDSRGAGSTVQRNEKASSSVAPTSSLNAMLHSFQSWLRQHLGGGPFAVLLAIFAIATIGRRVIASLQNSGSLTSARAPLRSTAAPASSRRLGPSTAQSGEQGLISTVWQKILGTVRMGTQVTYL